MRFAVSPLTESVLSARLLASNTRRHIHEPLLRRARELAPSLDLAPLEMFMHAPNGFIPDFSAPPPENPFPTFDAEIATLRAVSPAVILGEVRRLRAARGVSARGADYYERDPVAAREGLVSALTCYWDCVLRPFWPELRTILEADVMRRARDLALYGPERVFIGIRPRLSVPDSLAQTTAASLENRAQQEGLLLLPSVFAWPNSFAVTEQPWKPTLVYPSRRAAELRPPRSGSAADPFALAVGRSKASLLRAARDARSSSELAKVAGLSAAAASQLLHRLLGAGLLSRQRDGRRVLYTLTQRGRAVVSAFET